MCWSAEHISYLRVARQPCCVMGKHWTAVMVMEQLLQCCIAAISQHHTGFHHRCEALTKLPGPSSPPFCWKPGCISGPRQRARMSNLQDRLGWTGAETDEDKKWVQILLH